MENGLFNKPKFIESYGALSATEERIKALSIESEKHYQELDKIICKSLIDYQWQPYYNEKAVFISLEGREAWHRWFLENEGGWLRFREVPNDFPHIRNYSLQDIVPSEINKMHYWIIPLPLFKELNKICAFTLYPDKHENYKF
jgi:hypothetical protein